LDDQDLVAGLREGQRAKRDEAVAVFMERYRPLFYHCIAQLETDQHAREDLCNEIVVYVLERLDRDSFDPSKGSFGTWLYRVAWCRCVDLKRKESTRRNPKLVPAGERMPERADSNLGPGEVAGENEIGDMVRKGMASLEAEERALLELRFVDERTIGEISELLSISLEQTKYRLKRASVALRRVLLNEFALEQAAE
jgi:RNA polymerase sigma-70 factor (ECF subfamily)